MNNIIKCIKLTKSYKDGDVIVHILKGISFELQHGDISAIIGKSGSGKTTLLHLLAGLDVPNSGDILFDGESITSMSSNQIATFRNKKLGFIYQFHHLMLDFNILENVAMPLLISNEGKRKSEEKAYEMLKIVNLEKKIKKYPSEISGGERQRVAIARAFVNKPSLIIADEPTGNLDQYNANVIFNLILKFNSCYNTSFLIVTHDSSLIKKIPVLFKIKNGKLYNYNN
ncbi:MAG: lipoprotein-releasing ABC transporter ATP-binding protein LolD [Buchnera aphidicola (Brevicoryne brassicae)]|uniref:Lipoprotein-releasing system ATP-binding protein LolD n=1 Tax=Buchnera aphidicola (Brevicoryne brassicae) TaxID=911343 RepID=A0AAJ5TX33_9GAMM|nr:lipoprotein-releasing ABC transporter ATP-binding protein LolD [Buchnera aphidicola]QCI19859.1 lipoprotein-releasing ABC transporter ATP-binding protein LolD [Buchnera aphidicola (Brevicoryne brassicae)]WAI18679.1 MAG: lipoprotein-releasing ABC transporter ATP-binding protein LolD [Buchnera aphidicola (Brevicoryne brassicae)]